MAEQTQEVLFISNDAPYGNERSYNALRLAMNLKVRRCAFFLSDGVLCARTGQQTPDGDYNVERMVKSLVRRGDVAA